MSVFLFQVQSYRCVQAWTRHIGRRAFESQALVMEEGGAIEESS